MKLPLSRPAAFRLLILALTTALLVLFFLSFLVGTYPVPVHTV